MYIYTCVDVVGKRNGNYLSLSLSLSLSLQSSSESGVNRVIQAVAHLYCTSCKSSYNDLSKIIQVSLLNFEHFLKYAS